MEKVAVITLNYKEYVLKFGREYSESLSKVNYPFDLFIVDNESTQESRNNIKRIIPQAQIIANDKNLGFAAGNNIAMQRAIEQGYKYILCLNMDVEVEPDFLEILVKDIDQEKVAAVQARLMLWPEKDKVNSLGNAIHYLGLGYSFGCGDKLEIFQDKYLQTREIAYASGAAVLFKTEILKQVGLFENDFFMYHEDLELGWRLRMAGYQSKLSFCSVVYHKYEFKRSVKQFYWMERNRYRTIFENYKILTLILIFPPLIVLELAMLFFSINSGTFKEKIKVYADLFSRECWQEFLKNRKLKQSLRTVKDQEIIKNFTGTLEFQPAKNIFLKIINPTSNLYFEILKILVIW